VEASVDARGGDTRAAWQTTDLVLKRRSLSSLLTSALAMSPFQGEKPESYMIPFFTGGACKATKPERKMCYVN
jgi:hypothetical protein